MRGKTRIGVGATIVFAAVFAVLGALVLPTRLPTPWVVTVAVIGGFGLCLVTWGLILYGIDTRRERKSIAQNSRIRDAETQARLARIRSDISNNEYWRMVADNYDDVPRVQAIDATLLELRAEELKLLGSHS